MKAEETVHALTAVLVVLFHMIDECPYPHVAAMWRESLYEIGVIVESIIIETYRETGVLIPRTPVVMDGLEGELYDVAVRLFNSSERLVDGVPVQHKHTYIRSINRLAEGIDAIVLANRATNPIGELRTPWEFLEE